MPDSGDEWSALRDADVGSESRATIRHLRQAVADLVRCAQSDLLPLQKLELLCTQLGTAEHWLAQIEAERDTRELAGPHFAPDVPVRVVRD